MSFELSFSQAVFDFNSKIYAKVQAAQDQQLVTQGLALVNDKEFNVPI